MATKKSAPKKRVAFKTKATRASSATEKKSALQTQIAALQAQVEALNTEAVEELKFKINDTRKTLRAYELQLEELTGKPAGAPKVRRERRSSISDEQLQPQVLKAMGQHGKAGINAKQLAKHLNQDALRIRKFISANPKVLKRTGNGPGTKFFLP